MTEVKVRCHLCNTVIGTGTVAAKDVMMHFGEKHWEVLYWIVRDKLISVEDISMHFRSTITPEGNVE
jgi:hypothetical protein